MLRIIPFLLCLSMAFSAFPQGYRDRNRPFTLRGAMGIPKPLSSRMFRTAFDGILEGAFSGNIRVAGNFFAGAGYQFTMLENNKAIFRFISPPNLPGFHTSYTTRQIAHSPFINLGFDKFFSKNGYMSYSLKSGVALVNYTNVNPDSSLANRPFVRPGFSSGFMQPEASVNFLAGDHLAFNIYLNYPTVFYRFDPRAPRFAHVEEVTTRVTRRGERVAAGNNYVMSWFSFGFGFNILLGRK